MNNFLEENLKSIRIISAAISQPIAIACYSQEDEDLVSGIESVIKSNGYTCADLISWCESKNLQFSVNKTPKVKSRKFN